MGENEHLEHAHNLVLDYAVMAGIPGAVAILVLFISFMNCSLFVISRKILYLLQSQLS
jgi:hypothetical protein